MPVGLLFRLFVRLVYARLPSVTTHANSKWLIKCILISAAIVENAFPLSLTAWMTCSSKCAISVHQTCVFIPFSVSE